MQNENVRHAEACEAKVKAHLYGDQGTLTAERVARNTIEKKNANHENVP